MAEAPASGLVPGQAPDQDASRGPYATAAQLYRDLGWPGPLPVKEKDKDLPVGFTGKEGRWPTADDVQNWIAVRGADNITLRLPEDVIGIDVDAYDNKNGLRTIEEFEQHFGELPPTWKSSSRNDGSGILFFKIPVGPRWVSDLGTSSDVQIVRFGHRHAVCWPSVHPRIHQTYRWFQPDGILSEKPPQITDLPDLPYQWIIALDKGNRSSESQYLTTDISEEIDTEVWDHLGNRVDPNKILSEGLPIGEQEAGLFSYLCSLRARGAHRDEMIVLGIAAMQRFDNEPGREPWTIPDVRAKVDHIRDTYPPGSIQSIPSSLQRWAEDARAQLLSSQNGSGGTGDPNDPGGPPPTFTAAQLPPINIIETDTGNAIRFARMFKDTIKFTTDEGCWYIWDQNRWAPSPQQDVLDKTTSVIQFIRLDAVQQGTQAAQKRLNDWAKESESAAKRGSMIKLAEAERNIATTSHHFDTDPYLLVVRNGTINMRTDEFYSSRPEDFCSRQAAVTYNPHAECPLWKEHIDFVANHDEVMKAFLQRCIGYSLTGDVGERAFFFLIGGGSNGKNAMIEPLIQMLGTYAMTKTSSLLTGGDEQHPTDMADLHGVRMVFVDEVSQSRQLNAERIKTMTGAKRLRARKMREDFFEFDVKFKLWIAGNNEPRVRDQSDGIWDRMHKIYFRNKVGTEVPRIINFSNILYNQEASGILNWALEGLRDYLSIGSLGVPEEVERATQEYRDEEDIIKQFIADRLIITDDPEDRLGNAELYDAYQQWSMWRGFRGPDIHNAIRFGRELSTHGVRSISGSGFRAKSGVRLKTADTFRSSDVEV